MRLDLEHAGPLDRARQRDQRGLWRLTGPCQRRYVGQGLHVLHQSRRSANTPFERVGRHVGGGGDAFVQEMDSGRLRSRDISGGSSGGGHKAALGLRAGGQRAQHRVASRIMTLPDVENHGPRAQHTGGDESAVQHKVRSFRHEDPVLLALGLAFGAVDDDHSVSARSLRDGPPLGRDRKTSAAAADQARALDRFDDFAADFRQRTHRVSGAEQAGHHASRLSTADRNIVRAAASGSAEPEVSRKKIAIPTPATHAAVMASIQADHVSVPVPNPCRTPTGHAA